MSAITFSSSQGNNYLLTERRREKERESNDIDTPLFCSNYIDRGTWSFYIISHMCYFLCRLTLSQRVFRERGANERKLQWNFARQIIAVVCLIRWNFISVLFIVVPIGVGGRQSYIHTFSTCQINSRLHSSAWLDKYDVRDLRDLSQFRGLCSMNHKCKHSHSHTHTAMPFNQLIPIGYTFCFLFASHMRWPQINWIIAVFCE